jgi:hypothetical protein
MSLCQPTIIRPLSVWLRRVTGFAGSEWLRRVRPVKRFTSGLAEGNVTAWHDPCESSFLARFTT